MYTNELIRMYDEYGEQLLAAPIAHTKISSDFVIMLDANGFKMAAEVHEYVSVPCTVESETRSSNIAPHLIHDNISYVADIADCEKRHEAYLNQLHDYISNCNDPYAKAVYDYVSTADVLHDLEPVMERAKIRKPLLSWNIVFLVYPAKDTINLTWTNYYVNTLPKNGICSVTGEPDYIPQAYPSKIRNPSDMAKLFANGSNVGYIASQKIIHILQVLANNQKEIKAEIAPSEITNFYIKGAKKL